MLCASSASVCLQVLPLPPSTFFCANNWRSTRNAPANHGALPMPPASLCSGSLSGLTGVQPCVSSNLRHMVTEWVRHYNASGPHMFLGPGIPQPPILLPGPVQDHRHRLPTSLRVEARPILG